MEDTGSTEVVYKIRQWSLPGAAIVLVLNVSSRVFWLELDDKALLDAILCYRSGLSLQLGPFLLRKSQNRSLGRLQAKHLWMEFKLRWRVLADRMCTKAPAGWEVQRRTWCSAFWHGRQTQPHRPIWRKISLWRCNQRSPNMVEAMQRVHGTL